MKLFWIIALCAMTASAQEAAYQDLSQSLVRAPQESFGDYVHRIGLHFVGTPYVEKTLDQAHEETLVVNFKGMDCVTFVESILASSRSAAMAGSYATFLEELEALRYRDGKRQAYGSRLHYFSEWGLDNQARGHIVDITKSLGGHLEDRPIYFMSTHRDAYPRMTPSDEPLIKQAETRISQSARYVLPKSQVEAIESQLQNGDIIAITTGIKGLDILHTGLVSIREGRVHLLHASSKYGKVIVSEEFLVDYLNASKSRTGIMVFRPTDPAQEN